MNWFAAILQTIAAAISSALARPRVPEPPAPPPSAPGFDKIRADEDKRIEAIRAAERTSMDPVVTAPRAATPSAVDRAEDAGAMSETVPTVRRPD